MKKFILLLFICCLGCEPLVHKEINKQKCISKCIDETIRDIKPDTAMFSTVNLKYNIKEIKKRCYDIAKKNKCIGVYRKNLADELGLIYVVWEYNLNSPCSCSY